MTVGLPFIVTVLCLVGCSAPTAGRTQLQQPPVGRQADISGVPDYPLATVPAGPVSPQFVLEHRSALNGKTVRLRGTVVRAILPADGSAGGSTLPGANPQPRVFLAAGPATGDQAAPELMMLLRAGDPGFGVAQIIEVDVLVEASAVAIVVTRIYPQI